MEKIIFCCAAHLSVLQRIRALYIRFAIIKQNGVLSSPSLQTRAEPVGCPAQNLSSSCCRAACCSAHWLQSKGGGTGLITVQYVIEFGCNMVWLMLTYFNLIIHVCALGWKQTLIKQQRKKHKHTKAWKQNDVLCLFNFGQISRTKHSKIGQQLDKENEDKSSQLRPTDPH